MKRLICLVLIFAISVMPVVINAEDTDLSVDVVFETENIEVGDQFLVEFKLSKEVSYLTFQVNGVFDTTTAEIVAPVYSNEVIAIVDNRFDNEKGMFNLAGYDQKIRGTNEIVVASILFKAKQAGEFTISLTDETMLGKANENAFYNIAAGKKTIVVKEDIDGENVSIIEDTKPLTPYEDMLMYDWAEPSVAVMLELGALEGIADELFYPDRMITRGEFLTMLMRVCKQKSAKEVEPFKDVPETSYQYEAVMTAKALGIAKGDGDGNLNANAPITREDVCTLVYRTMLKMDKVNPEIDINKYLGSFTDSTEVYDYAKESVAGLIRAKLIVGDENSLLRPKSNMTRAEAAVLLNRLCDYNILITR